jgi:hypothetical protein
LKNVLQHWIFGRSKPETIDETLTWEIREPTLDTLDRISEISLKIAVSEEELRGSDISGILSRTKKLARENARNLARIVAIAVLGEDYYETEITQVSATSVKIKQHKQDEREQSGRFVFPYRNAVEAGRTGNRNNKRFQPRGFFNLYAITERRTNSNTGKGKHRVTGLQSPYGRRGSICAYLGWTWDYLHHDIAWNIVQRILIDAPNADYDSETEVKQIQITNENAQEILDKINRIKR